VIDIRVREGGYVERGEWFRRVIKEASMGLDVMIPDVGHSTRRFEPEARLDVRLRGRVRDETWVRCLRIAGDPVARDVVEEKLREPRHLGVKQTECLAFFEEPVWFFRKTSPAPVVKKFSLELEMKM
jgi:hypothetical protein